MTAIVLEPTDDVARLRTSSTAKLPRRLLLRPLGIVGYDAVEPGLLAALATEEPLLLVSDHGAAKTLLLLRLAESLGPTLRFYNASILQFDDLAGFPIPDERGTTPRRTKGSGAQFLPVIVRNLKPVMTRHRRPTDRSRATECCRSARDRPSTLGLVGSAHRPAIAHTKSVTPPPPTPPTTAPPPCSARTRWPRASRRQTVHRLPRA